MANRRAELKSLTTEELILQLRTAPLDEASPYCEELIVRFEPLLRRAWQRDPGSDYQDFAQDVFVRLFAGLPQLRNAKAFPGYFRSVALSVAARHWRKQKLDVKKTDRDKETPFARTEDSLVTGIFVRSYLEHLPLRERQIIEMVFIEDRPMKEIAEALGLDTGTIRATKSRALKRLRRFILSDAKSLEEKHVKR